MTTIALGRKLRTAGATGLLSAYAAAGIDVEEPKVRRQPPSQREPTFAEFIIAPLCVTKPERALPAVPPARREFGESLRRDRHRAAMTMDDLVALSGVSKAYISLIENGQIANPPSDGVLIALASAMGHPAERYLYPAHLWQTPPDVLRRLNELERAAVLREMPAEQRELAGARE